MLGLQTHATLPSFYEGTGDLNLNPHACSADALPTEPDTGPETSFIIPLVGMVLVYTINHPKISDRSCFALQVLVNFTFF